MFKISPKWPFLVSIKIRFEESDVELSIIYLLRREYLIQMTGDRLHLKLIFLSED